jgi:hypothetical protein
MPHDPLMRWETEGGAIDLANGYEAQPEEASDYGELAPGPRGMDQCQRQLAPPPAPRPLEPTAAAW